MRTIVRASVIAAAVMFAGAAVAQEATPASTELTAAQVVQKLEAAGYTDIRDIEKDDGVWEVEATSPSGVRIDLDLDLKDGRILREDRDDD